MKWYLLGPKENEDDKKTFPRGEVTLRRKNFAIYKTFLFKKANGLRVVAQ